MKQIACIFREHYIYWNSIILILAIAVAIFTFLALYLNKSGNAFAAFAAVPLAVLLSFFASRFVHWYSFADSYESFSSAMIDYSEGGYALLGAFAGCFLAAVFTRAVKIQNNSAEMLDCMCLAGGAGITIGRLSSFYDASNRGQIVDSVHSLPWVYLVKNIVSDAEEYRLATFLLQAIVTGTIFVILTVFYVTGDCRKLKDGDTSLLFLLCYCASQIVLDSTRYDSMYFRSNGFVSMVQVFCALTVVFVIVIFSIRLNKTLGFRFWYIALWTGMAVLLGCAGYMEYYVQRHGDQALFAYCVMSISLSLLLVITLAIRSLSIRKMLS